VNVLFAGASCARPDYENINDPNHIQQAFACHESKVLLKWHSRLDRVFESPKERYSIPVSQIDNVSEETVYL